MAKVRLGDIATVVTKGTTPTTIGFQFEDSGINFVKIESISEDGTFLKEKFSHISDECNVQMRRSQLQENDILFSIAGAIGRSVIVTKEILPANTNQALAIIRVPKGKIDYNYLLYALSSSAINQQATQHQQGVAQLNISLKNVSDFLLPIYTEAMQKRIVQNLKKIDKLIFLRKQQLAKLDELVKARFVEMFGDPVVNSKRWPVETIENHIDLLTGFPFDSSGYVSKGINICGGLIIMPQKIDWSACKHWPQVTGYEDYILRPNDIVIALDRPWISNGFKIAMVDKEHLPALLIQRTARIRAVDINQHYLMQSLLLGRFDKHCNITGSLVPHISPKDIKSYSVMIPPIELQNQFSTFVERVDQQKQTVQQSLEKLELMKKALMQEYFG